jgi:hypothetical protein
MTEKIFCPETGNLSVAWATLFDALMSAPGGELEPALIVIDEFDENGLPIEVPDVRKNLDQALLKFTKRDCEDVASTIFPFSLWNRALRDGGQHVFERYTRIWPKLKKRSPSNARGNYFQRLVDFEEASIDKTKSVTNQLQTVLSNYKKTHRRSALQVTIFDPKRDLAPTPMQGFPCLQQIAFSPTKEGLVVTGYYVLQHVFERGYGNYLGLCRLGAFMAQQLDMPLAKIVTMLSFAAYANDRKIRKSDLLELQEFVRPFLPKKK